MREEGVDGTVEGLTVGDKDRIQVGRVVTIIEGASEDNGDGFIVVDSAMEGLEDGPLEGGYEIIDVDTREGTAVGNNVSELRVDDTVGIYVGASTLLEKAPNRIHLASDGVSPFNKNSIWYPCSRILASGGATTRRRPLLIFVNVGKTTLCVISVLEAPAPGVMIETPVTVPLNATMNELP